MLGGQDLRGWVVAQGLLEPEHGGADGGAEAVLHRHGLDRLIELDGSLVDAFGVGPLLIIHGPWMVPDGPGRASVADMDPDLPAPLIAADDLLARLDDPRLRIADVRWYLGEPERGYAEYQAGHIFGAVFVDLDRDLAAASGPGRHPLPDPVRFADRLGGLGFGDGHHIVIYDGVDGRYGARMWWMLDRLGHKAVAMLDGGLPAWLTAGGELSVARSSPLRANLTLAPEWSGIIDRQSIIAQQGRIDLIDVRTAERYRGEVEPMEAIAGHIPGARNRSCDILVNEDGTMLPPDRLQVILGAQDPRADRPTVVSCGSGVTACFGALAHRVAGMADPILYPGSYSDWVRSGQPVATGEKPYEVPQL